MEDVMFNFLKFIFPFINKDKKTVIKNEINLNRWNNLLLLNGTWITTIISLNKIEDIGKALVYSNKNIQERFIREAYDSGFKNEAQQIRNYLERNTNISKLDSDRMKAIVANAFTEKRDRLYKGLLPPGWI
jgi:hypothetical protein